MIPFQTISGDHRAIGRATGELMGPWLRKLVDLYPRFYRRQGLDYTRLRARALDFLPPSRNAFPTIIKEYEAIARAAKISFADAWFIVTEEDVCDELEKCTSIMIQNRNGQVLVHNEDYDGRYRGMVAVQTIRPSRGVPFVRFVYPSGLPGSTALANAAGIAFSEDSLHFPVDPSGVTKNVILRALSSARSLQEISALIRKIRPSNSFALNVISRRERKAISIERTPERMAIIPVRQVLVHANAPIRPRELRQKIKPSHHSHARVRKVHELMRRDHSFPSAARALAQTSLVRSPYRGPKAYMTIATVAADLSQNKFGVKVWGSGKPSWEWFAIPTM